MHAKKEAVILHGTFSGFMSMRMILFEEITTEKIKLPARFVYSKTD
jgi:hypothetical protein